MKFQLERLTLDLMDEMMPLLVAHYNEISANLDIPLKPRVDKYIDLDEAGFLRVYTARDESGLLIGYAVFTVNYSMHYADSYQAIQDIIYIDKSRRGFGSKFISWCDSQLRDEGVQIVYHHVKAKHNWSHLLQRLNYNLVDLIYSRRLDDKVVGRIEGDI